MADRSRGGERAQWLVAERGRDARRKMFIFLRNQGLGSIPLVFAIFLAARFPADLRLQDYPGALILVIRAAVQRLCSRTATRLASGKAHTDAFFADEMAVRAIAEHTEAANVQHWEVPAAFFVQLLGPNRKYFSCFYKEPQSRRHRGGFPRRLRRRHACGCSAGAGSSSPHQACSATRAAANGASANYRMRKV